MVRDIKNLFPLLPRTKRTTLIVPAQQRISRNMDRPSWNQYFMGIAHYISLRTHDAETKVGCVIVNDSKHVVSLGYNGFCAGVDDESLPNTRPNKYPFMVHAEQNAISNLIVRSSKPLVAYITHMPCHTCAKLLWQNNVRHWFVEENSSAVSSSEKDKIVFDFLLGNGLGFDTIQTDTQMFDNVRHQLIENQKA